MSGNVFYDPEKFGLTVVGQLNDPNASYSFDDLVVWSASDGRLFYAMDSGCSCPTPFEQYHGLADLTPITAHPDSFASFERDVANHCDTFTEKNRLLDDVASRLGVSHRPIAAPPPERAPDA